MLMSYSRPPHPPRRFVLSAVTASLVTTLLLAVLQLAKGERWGVLASLLQLLIGWAGLLLWLTAAVVATERSAVAGAQAPGFRRALCIAVAWLVAAFTASQACAAWELLHSGMCGCSRVEAYWVAALDGPNAPGGSSCGRGGRGGGSGRGLPTYKRLARADRLACIVEESTSDLEECLSPPTEGDELSCSCGAGSCNPACPAWSPAPAGHSADASVAAGAAGGKGGAAERPSGAVPQPLVHAHSE